MRKSISQGLAGGNGLHGVRADGPSPGILREVGTGEQEIAKARVATAATPNPPSASNLMLKKRIIRLNRCRGDTPRISDAYEHPARDK
jgi:hypothetical protein